MQRDLERRLQALETNWFGSPESAAEYRAVRAMSDEELDDALRKAAESDEGLAKLIDAEFGIRLEGH